jgi:hypothetical protein
MNHSRFVGLKNFPDRVLGGCSEGPIEPGIYAEDLLQHLGMDAVMALRPFTGRKEGHVVKAVALEREAHMSYALWGLRPSLKVKLSPPMRPVTPLGITKLSPPSWARILFGTVRSLTVSLPL